jgi:hypothetical protein
MSSESYLGYPECVVSCHGAGRLANSIRPFFETTSCSHTTTCLDCIAGCGVLTANHIRHIRSLLSGCPGGADNGYGAKLPDNPAQGKIGGKSMVRCHTK